MMLTRIGYRMMQFGRGFIATVDAHEQSLLAQILTPKAVTLFQRMPVDAQRHSLNVLHTLRSAGHDHPDLAVAALLHDVGKVAANEAGVPLRLWVRGPLVLAEAVAGAWLQTFTSTDPSRGWRYALYVHYAHPQIGALWAQEAGCSVLACWLIAHHQEQEAPKDVEPTWTHLLMALQWADGRN